MAPVGVGVCVEPVAGGDVFAAVLAFDRCLGVLVPPHSALTTPWTGFIHRSLHFNNLGDPPFPVFLDVAFGFFL
jgi:hypothetical protein